MPDIKPLSHADDSPQPPAGFTSPPSKDANNAADLIRSKLDRIYADEPDAAVELQEAEAVKNRSVHQEFMHSLSSSGKDLATIQTEWHNYYVSLNDKQKHQVWQEFYSTSSAPKAAAETPQAAEVSPHAIAEHKHEAHTTPRYNKSRATRKPRAKRDLRSPQAIRAAIRDQVTAGGKLQAKHHIQSLLFGLGVGAVTIFIFLFSFFNEVIIAPFIQPSRAAAATPIIIDSSSVAPTAEPQVIIPKINVQIPVVYDLPDGKEDTVQNALESGVAHYPTTPKPGTQGNAAFFGHSSNNIFNKGEYKFAFVLLNQLVEGDTFYLTYDKKIYVYKVITKTVVDPSQVEVLNSVPGKTSTATLITCDPPGTTLKRMVVVGEQISPDPSGNTAPEPVAETIQATSAASLAGNAPTLGGRLLSTGIGKAFAGLAVIAIIAFAVRWLNKPEKASY